MSIKYSIDLDAILLEAEMELNRSLTDLYIRSRYITEISDIRILNEDFKETIIKYVNKIATNISKVWELFKAKIPKKPMIDMINKNKKYLENTNYKGMRFNNPKEGTVLVSFPIWDQIKDNLDLSNNTLDSQNYNSMKENLETVDKFIVKYYGSTIGVTNTENKINVKEAIFKKVFIQATSGTIITSKEILPYRDFILNYQAEADQIAKDVKAVNDSNKNIQTMLNSVLANSTSESFIGYNYLDFLHEEVTKAVTTTSMTTGGSTNTDTNKNTDGKLVNVDPQDDNKKDGKDRQNIVNYYTAQTKVFSAKLATCNKILFTSYKLCRSFIKLQGGKDKVNNEENTNTTETGTVKEVPL